MSDSKKIVIGLTGPFGSGCTYIANSILKESGYEYISLSDILRALPDCSKEIERTDLQDFGNKVRKEKGNDYLASVAIEHIMKSDKTKFVVDSIRNTHEVDLLENTFASFYLLATWATKDVRWNRVKDKYSGDNSLFEKDDNRDNNEKIENGQQITLCYQMADFIVLNEDHIYSVDSDKFKELRGQVNRYIGIVEQKEKFSPNEMETFMAMAYANSMRSSCLQRKVGALIIDDSGNVFSSGYNEVPASEFPCKNVYGRCYRKYLREKIDSQVKTILDDDEKSDKISDLFKSNSKMLDYCRSLHAEESAIVNMARLGVSANINNATLYTTTYPCNLCANKIAQVGIKNVVYYEPYPQEEAKRILHDHSVEQKPFQGVTFNGYFRFMEVLR